MTEQERKAPLDIKDITVDVGAVSREEAIEVYGIRIGEPVVPDVTFTYAEDTDLMVGKSFDCRLGCAAILKTMHELAGQELAVDIVGACASQEEVGVRGATVTAQVIQPDLAIVFEGCPADDTCVEPYMVQTAIKRGPMLRHIDSRMITNPRYQRYARGSGGEAEHSCSGRCACGRFHQWRRHPPHWQRGAYHCYRRTRPLCPHPLWCVRLC